ncbi:MAG: hypothetical protein ACXWBP_05330, partial [Limisphaerales bacterium]
FPLALLPRMLACAGIGALIAGIYGIVHDQFTYIIAPEYFTKLKFEQFRYADFGFPRRVYVAEIGFLATCWVGLFAGWFIARSAVPFFDLTNLVRHCTIAFAITFAIAIAGTVCGYAFGVFHGANYSSWEPVAYELKIVDLPSFVRVAYIHNGSYAGGLCGLIVALFYIRRAKQSVNKAYM